MVILSIYLSRNDIAKVMWDKDKARVHDMICIHTLKICGDSIQNIFKFYIKKGQLPDKSKKINSISVLKKDYKYVSRN